MKRFFIAAIVTAAALSAPALASDVGVSINIGHPGFYGRLDVGGFPPPVLLYPEPIRIERGPVGRPPLYLRVPPGHAKHWRKHCHSYRACGERVYFVRDDWYNHEYAPRYRERHGHRHGYDRDHRRDDFRHDDRHDHRGDDRRHRRHDDDNHDRGRGRGRD